MSKKYQSNLEQLMEQYLNELGYHRDVDFSFNCDIRTRYGYRLDFAFLNIKLGIECDGEHWHQPNNHHDRKRDAFFKSKGWNILRFTGIEIMNNPDAVKNKINEVMKDEKNISKN
jgi:very-short-patch-repair endonuclease